MKILDYGPKGERKITEDSCTRHRDGIENKDFSQIKKEKWGKFLLPPFAPNPLKIDHHYLFHQGHGDKGHAAPPPSKRRLPKLRKKLVEHEKTGSKKSSILGNDTNSSSEDFGGFSPDYDDTASNNALKTLESDFGGMLHAFFMSNLRSLFYAFP